MQNIAPPSPIKFLLRRLSAMCWSGEASAALATVGFGTSGYVAYKGESKELWIPLFYFVCMVLPILR